MIRSARTKMDSGIFAPSTSAVFRLTSNSNFDGPGTGQSGELDRGAADHRTDDAGCVLRRDDTLRRDLNGDSDPKEREKDQGADDVPASRSQPDIHLPTAVVRTARKRTVDLRDNCPHTCAEYVNRGVGEGTAWRWQASRPVNQLRTWLNGRIRPVLNASGATITCLPALRN